MGSIPLSAIPPACDTISCSAIPHSKKRSGNRSENGINPVSRIRSASRATTPGFFSAIVTSAFE